MMREKKYNLYIQFILFLYLLCKLIYDSNDEMKENIIIKLIFNFCC